MNIKRAVRGPEPRWNRVLILFFAVLILALRPAAAADLWTGAGGTSWATSTSWSPSGGPTTTDTASFTDTGSTSLLGDLTSLLNADRTIGGLSFSNTANHYHTLDLATHTLTVTGNLNINLDQGANSITTIRNGTLSVSGAFANINVGRAVSGSAIGTLDLSGLTSVNATLQSLQIGSSTAGGATGTLTLAPSNTISAQLIDVGTAFNSQDARGTLHLGLTNIIQTAELDISKDNGNGLIDIVNNGSLTLGTVSQRTILQIANQNTNTGNIYTGTLDLGNAVVNLHLDSLIVAQKTGGPGTTIGQVFGGSSGSVVIGDPAVRGNWYVANTINGGATNGTVDFSHMSALQAYLNDLLIGKGTTGSASGTVSLADSNSIDVSNSIVVGAANLGSGGTLTFGHTNIVFASQLIIGQDYANGLVKIVPGGTLNLGSALRRTSIFLANSNTNSPDAYAAKLDLTGGTLNAYVGDLIVGQRLTSGGGPAASGTLIAGNTGTIDIGAPGNSANFYVGRGLGASATGIADFSGLSSLTASVNTLAVGNGIGGTGNGILSLAASNTLSANTILIGVGAGDSSGTLNLGHTNVILANQLTIGQDYAYGALYVPSGGTLTLGSPAQPTSLTMGTAITNTGNIYTGIFDASNASVTAYLDAVKLGDKNAQPGGETATLTLSNHADNYIQANTIAMAADFTTANLTFAGGTFFANSITAGSGTANFNWNGGQLSVITFGSPSRLFNLANSGTGTLAPGTAGGAVATTTVYGNYTQAATATANFRIAGNTPGTGNDLLAVSGTATLAGTLKLSFLNNFTPSVGQNYLIATYASRSGTFAFVAPPVLPQNVAFQLDYTTNLTQLLVHMVAPAAQTWTSTAPTATLSTAGNWNTGTAPTTSSADTIVNTTASAQTITLGSSITVHSITLSGTTAPVSLEVPQGIQLGVAYQLYLGTNASLIGGGQVLGQVVNSIGGAITPSASLQISGNVNNSGQVSLPSGATLDIDGNFVQSAPGFTTGPGTLLANAYLLNSGTLQVGVGGATGALGTGPIANNGTLEFNRNNSLSLPNVLTGAGTLLQAGAGTTTLLGAANYSGPTTISAGLLNFSGGVAHSIGKVTGPGTLQVDAGTTLTSDGVNLRAGTWIINGIQVLRSSAMGGAYATFASGNSASALSGTSEASTLTFGAGARLDLQNNALILEATSGTKAGLLALIASQVTLGTITSSTAATNPAYGVVVVNNADLSATTFGGVAVDANSIIVTQALLGDANLDGVVNPTDLLIYAHHFNNTGSYSVAQGDFNHDGVVNPTDLLIYAHNFNNNIGSGVPSLATGGSLSDGLDGSGPTGGAAATPEPASLMLLGLGAANLLLKRKRRNPCRT